jgi:hypothetical protein
MDVEILQSLKTKRQAEDDQLRVCLKISLVLVDDVSRGFHSRKQVRNGNEDCFVELWLAASYHRC